MGEVCIDIPDEMDPTLKEFRMDWAEVGRRAILGKAERLRRLKLLTSGIRVSDKKAKEFTDRISESVAMRYR
jgi:hypothetical protein